MPNEIESYTPFYKGKPLYGLGGGGGGSSTDENVMQTPTDNSNNDYEVLMSYSADNTERTEGARKTQHIKFNPFTKLLKLTGHLYDKWGLQTSRTMFEEDFQQLTQAERDNGTNYYIPDREPLKICDYIYPVGAIYMSVNNINPAILFGGTWERIEDKFLLAAGSTYNSGATGGDAKHTHNYGIQLGGFYYDTTWEGDSNSGLLSYDIDNNITLNNSKPNVITANTTINGGNTTSSKTANGLAHYRAISNTSYTSNMPPYLVVNVWVRVPDPVEQEEEEGE